MSELVQFQSASLTIQVSRVSSYTVGRWTGAAGLASRETVSQAVAQLLDGACGHLVLEFGQLTEVCDPAVELFARLIGEVQRRGEQVCLVRCGDELFRRLQRAGVAGSVAHAGSLVAATRGQGPTPASTLDLYLRSIPSLLHRVRNVVSVVAREAGMPQSVEQSLKLAVTEAAANAMVHGSPEGPRNHVRVSFHLEPHTEPQTEPRMLIVDVADQGKGFDPAVVDPGPLGELRDHGYGLHIMRQSMDRVEFFQDDRGMLIRLTKYIP